MVKYKAIVIPNSEYFLYICLGCIRKQTNRTIKQFLDITYVLLLIYFVFQAIFCRMFCVRVSGARLIYDDEDEIQLSLVVWAVTLKQRIKDILPLFILYTGKQVL